MVAAVIAVIAALRAGELDLALVRGPVRVRGLRAVELWRDRLHVVLPAAHPDAGAAAVPIGVLAEMTLRMPERSADTALHDAVLAAYRDHFGITLDRVPTGPSGSGAATPEKSS